MAYGIQVFLKCNCVSYFKRITYEGHMQCFLIYPDYQWRGLAQCMVTFTLFPQIRLLVPLSGWISVGVHTS